MRPSQQFRPSALVPLEARVVLSSYAHPVQAEHAIVAQTTPSATPSTPILSSFPLEAAALAAGNPVYERWTTTYYNGLTETNNETIVLNNQTVTITRHITLPGTEGTETEVDHYTATNTGILYQNTVTEPNGQTETENRMDTPGGPHHKVTYNGSFEQPYGVTVTVTGNSVEHGQRTVINKSFHESNGISYTTHEVDIHQGPWQTNATITTHWSDGSVQVDKDIVSGVVLSSPPS